MRPGDVIFVKKASTRGDGCSFGYSMKRGKETIALAIGTYDIKQELPSNDILVALLGEIGYFSGDFIVEVFGEKGFEKFSKAYREKYGK